MLRSAEVGGWPLVIKAKLSHVRARMPGLLCRQKKEIPKYAYVSLCGRCPISEARVRGKMCQRARVLVSQAVGKLMGFPASWHLGRNSHDRGIL